MAQLLLRRRVCEAISKVLIRERALRECKDIPAIAAECTKRMIYIPEKMPPREIPNTYFEDPTAGRGMVLGMEPNPLAPQQWDWAESI